MRLFLSIVVREGACLDNAFHNYSVWSMAASAEKETILRDYTTEAMPPGIVAEWLIVPYCRDQNTERISDRSWERPGSLQYRRIIGVRLKAEIPSAEFNATFQLWNVQMLKRFGV